MIQKGKISNGVKALVLRAAGINCDWETEYALELAGAQAQRIHINRLIEDKTALEKFQILVLPGGFSYGDDVAAGKILANQIRHHLYQPIQKFIDDGKLVLGICNGFQALVKTGILQGTTNHESRVTSHPSSEAGLLRRSGCEGRELLRRTDEPRVTITNNDSGKFEDRWVYLVPQTRKCIFLEPDRQIYLPVAHAEGKIVTKDTETLEELKSAGYVAFKYVDENGKEGGYPINPNGSVDSIAGLTDTTGRVLGLMPHPERHVRHTQHPRWSRYESRATSHEPRTPDGMTIFNNAVKYIQENF